MSEASKILIDQALELPASERAVVAEQLLLSLDNPNPELDAIWASEAEARLSAFRNGEEPVVNLEDVFKPS